MTLTYIYNIRNVVVVSAPCNTAKNCNKISTNKSFKSRIKQIATVSLIFLSMVTGEVFAGDKLPKSKASAGRKKGATFETINPDIA